MRAQTAIQEAIEKRGLTEYKVATSAGLDRALLHRALRGERPLSDEIIDKVAPLIGLDAEQLKAWADADRLGPEGLDRLMRHVTEQQDELVLLTQRFGRITQALSELEAEEKRLLLGPRDAKVNARLGEIASLIGRHKADLRADSMELRARAAEIDRLLSDLEGR